MRTAFSDFSPTAVARLYTDGAVPLSRISHLIYNAEGELALPLTGGAFSMRLWGTGKYTLKEGGASRTYSFDSDGKRFSAILTSGSGTLTFSGDAPFAVTELVTYASVRGSSKRYIPEGGGELCLDIKSYYDDFLSFAAAPTTVDGKVIKEAVLEGSRITLPVGYEGEILVLYYRMPRRIHADNEGELDIPEELTEPVLSLTASILLAEDAPELSEKLLAMYKDDVRVYGCAYRQKRRAEVISDGWA